MGGESSKPNDQGANGPQSSRTSPDIGVPPVRRVPVTEPTNTMTSDNAVALCLSNLSCPFTWGMEKEIMLCRTEEDLEEIDFPMGKLVFNLMMVYKYTKKNLFSKAVTKLEECEKIEKESFSSGSTALKHIVLATRCHVFHSIYPAKEILVLLKDIQPVDQMRNEEKGKLWGCQSVAWSEYFKDNRKAINFARRAIELDPNLSDCYYILGKNLGLLRKNQTPENGPSLEETDAIETAFHLSENFMFALFLAELYTESKEFSSALKLYWKIYEQRPKSCNIRLKLAFEFLIRRDLTRAADCMDYIYSQTPNVCLYLHSKGMSFRKTSEDDIKIDSDTWQDVAEWFAASDKVRRQMINPLKSVLEKLHLDIRESELTDLSCPFTWEMEGVINRPESLMRRDYIEFNADFPERKLVWQLMMSYEYANEKDISKGKALQKLEECEKVLSDIEKENFKDVSCTIAALEHIVQATEYYVLHKMNRLKEAKTVFEKICPVSKMNKIELATLSGCQSLAWTEYSETSMALKHVKRAIELDPNNSIWHLILSKNARSLRMQNKSELGYMQRPKPEEIDIIKKAFKTSPKPIVAAILVQLYQDCENVKKAEKWQEKLTDLRGLQLILSLINKDDTISAKSLFDSYSFSGQISDNAMYLHCKGIYFEKCERDLKSALECYRRAVDLKYYEAENHFIQCRLKLESEYDPVPYLLHMLDKYSERAGSILQEINLNIGAYYFFQNGGTRDLVNACKYYMRGIKINPRNRMLQAHADCFGSDRINVYHLLANEIRLIKPKKRSEIIDTALKLCYEHCSDIPESPVSGGNLGTARIGESMKPDSPPSCCDGPTSSKNEQVERQDHEKEQEQINTELLFNGCSPQPGEDVEKIALQIIEALPIYMPAENIVEVKTTRKRLEGKRGPIIVKFATKVDRDRIMEAKRKMGPLKSNKCGLPGPEEEIYVHENLTPYYRHLFSNAKQLRNRGYKSTWIKDGQIFVKNAEGQTFRLKCHEDLERLKTECNN